MKSKSKLAAAAFLAVYSMVKISTPTMEKLDEAVVRHEDQNFQENYQADPDIEQSIQKSFEDEYKDEPYIFLEHIIDIELREDWSYLTTIHKKMKVQKNGSKSLGTIPVRYIQGTEKIISIEAYTIGADGKKYSYSDIQDRPVYRGYKVYSDVRERIITLPKVTVGAILEYKVVKESKGKNIDNAFWHTGYLDYGVPTKYDRYSVSVPKNLDISYKEFNVSQKPEIRNEEGRIIYIFERKDAYEPYETEEYIPYPTHETLENMFEFSSIKRWQDIADWYNDLTLKQVVVTDEMEKRAKEIFEGEETLRDKALALKEYFNEKFRYISMSFGENTFEPHLTSEVFENKYGDCKDISLLFKTMLEMGGVRSHLALFAKESVGSDPRYDLPVPNLFGHVILLIEDPENGDFYLDPLLDGYYLEEYPIDYQGAYTLIIDGKGGRFDKIPIFDEYREYRRKHSSITIGSDGSRESESKNLWDLDFSIRARRMIKNMSREDIIKMLMSIDRGYSEVIDREWEGLHAKYGPIESYLKTRQDNYYAVTGDVIVINVDSYDGGRNFDDLDRKNDFFYPYNSLDRETTEYTLPEGYAVLHIPENVELDIGFFNFTRKYTRTREGQIVICEESRLKRATVSKEEVENVKEFFKGLSRASAQRIILKKRKPIIEKLRGIWAGVAGIF